MCSNRALVDSLECYMDDLVNCFEDFVKKSLIVISFGMGLIVAMLFYMVKMIGERRPVQSTTESENEIQSGIRNILEAADLRNVPKEGGNGNGNDGNNSQKTTSVNTAPILTSSPSFDEELLRNIGLTSCSRPGCRGRDSITNTPSRVPVLTTSPPKHKSIDSLRSSKHNISPPAQVTKSIKKENSCNSMCCDNNNNRKSRTKS